MGEMSGLDRRAVVAELLRDPDACPGGPLLRGGLGSSTYDAGAACGDRPENFYLRAPWGAAMIGLGSRSPSRRGGCWSSPATASS
jgi:hypothetical protein